MAKGERGTAKPYLRGKIWWIRYSVPGEGQERFESSKSTIKNDAIRLLNKRRKEIDDRQITSADATVSDLFTFTWRIKDDNNDTATNRRMAMSGCTSSRLSGRSRRRRSPSKMIEAFIDQKQISGLCKRVDQPLARGSASRLYPGPERATATSIRGSGNRSLHARRERQHSRGLPRT